MKMSYGGVVINQDGEVLLREPAGHFGGYVWTFAKGEPEPRESVEETALREVLEETGVVANIMAKIPGSFRGSTTDNAYFLMSLVKDTKEFGDETESVRWVTQSEAEELILETTNTTGRQRDLRLLKAAFETLRSTNAQGAELGIPEPKQNPAMVQKGSARRNLSWRGAIIEVLSTAQKPLCPADIIAAITESGLRPVSGRTPEATVAAKIYSSIKKDGEASPFRQTGPSEFMLKQPDECSGVAAPSHSVARFEHEVSPSLTQVAGSARVDPSERGVATGIDERVTSSLHEVSKASHLDDRPFAGGLLPGHAQTAEEQQSQQALDQETRSKVPLPHVDPIDWQPGDEFVTVGAIRNGDIIFFERAAHKKFLMKTLSEQEATAFQGKKYRIQRGEKLGSFDLVAV